MSERDAANELTRLFNNLLAEQDGYARQASWECEDGWIVSYTTERIQGGPPERRGKFATMAYRPEGKGARSGKASKWVRVYFRTFSKRKAAKARAVKLFYEHSPKRAARDRALEARDHAERFNWEPGDVEWAAKEAT